MQIIDLNSPSVQWNFRNSIQADWHTATVPGCVHRDLLQHSLIPNPFWAQNEEQVQWVGQADWEYEASFEANAAICQETKIELVCQGLDTLSTLRLNGQVIGTSNNMFLARSFDISPYIKVGKNLLTLRFDSAEKAVQTIRPEHTPRDIMDPVGGCTRIRKQQAQFGWDWGPRLVSAGIYAPIQIEASSHPRIANARIAQIHQKNNVTLAITPELRNLRVLPNGYEWAVKITHNEEIVASEKFPKSKETSDLEVQIKNPNLWWPNGQGEQPLYSLRLELQKDGLIIDQWIRRIGLRTIEHRRQNDSWGESFQFVVNGRPIFAKGANWIPAHSLVGGLKRDDFLPLLQSAAASYMNMIRAWAGGVYEQEAFYDICDELGLLVWQDFMFACTLYPGDKPFLDSVKEEAVYQVSRLRHRACLALWCGNNELESHNAAELENKNTKAAYNAVFRKILPNAVKQYDGTTAYWRCSPSQSERPGVRDRYKSGNAHFWQVWFARKPAQAYEEHIFRFVSEFGMQSFPSLATAKTFLPTDQINAFSPAFEAHQKNPAGNSIILDYVFRRYRYARDYSSLAYLSQLNQAYCIQIGVEHYRRQQPRCSGALYWQLNDCWPGASWSSIEFGGRWKALHYAARIFFAPALLTARVSTSVPSSVDLHTVFDGPQSISAEIHWELMHLNGSSLLNGSCKARLSPGESKRRRVLKLKKELQKWGKDSLYLRYSLYQGIECLMENTLLFCEPRQIDLPRTAISIAIKKHSRTSFTITLKSSSYHHRVEVLHSQDSRLKLSDNFFDLYPRRSKTIQYECDTPTTIQSLKQSLATLSLANTYD
ncbi:hypothetical protein MLD52_22340 [Puniceicoccaceae bacterium K14]|nr:hypothetical protein [Puniceicoccaceae bacterium K14]